MPYYGGKQTIAYRIVGLLPPHLHYVEPYAGGLSVLLAKPLTRMETVNDLDGNLVAFWRALRDQPEDLARVCQLTPHSRSEYDACRRAIKHGSPCSDLERARRVWVCLTQGRGGTLRTKGSGWRHYVVPRSSATYMPGYLDGYVARMAAVAERIHSVSLECLPALDLIDKYGGDPETLLYVDPPYLGSTRGHGDQYRHEMRTDAEHRELSEALHACSASVVLSGYASPLYEELYAGWDTATIDTYTGNGVGARGVGRVETLWSNRELGTQPALDLFGGAA